ncbi:universal stress protein [Salinicoccus albus]|uniref:universal stress protein n=1 Tax=Salinicoccus albus TaxID=418756 RepID=UPI000367BAC0|nr:universal stress protein [Salinicoccus albus]
MKNLFPSYREENVLVMLDFESYNPNTILRGAKLAEAFQCKFSVLFLEYIQSGVSSAEKELYLTESKKLSEDLNVAEYRVETFERHREILKILHQFAKEKAATQLVLAHIPESRWEELVSGTFANYVLKKMPFLELHFIAPDIAFPYGDWEYNKGRYGALEPSGRDGEFVLVTSQTQQSVEDGVFFKNSDTDFNTGIFVSYATEGDFNQYDVVKGTATKIE